MSEYKLDMVPLQKLRVDHTYARPVSEDRLRKLRKQWNLAKVGTIHVNKRDDGSLWLVDGQHRVSVALENGIEELPALVHQGADQATEADLYLGYADAFPQQALSQFNAMLVRGDREALSIKQAVESVGLKIGTDYKGAHQDDGTVMAVKRLVRIYSIGGGVGIRETLLLAKDAFGLDHRAYQESMLEALFQFYAAYHTMYDRERLIERLKESGLTRIVQRAYAIKSEGEWPRSVDALVQALWRTYHEPKLRSHRLPTWNGRRAKPSTDGSGVKPYAQGTRAARREKARKEREELSVAS